MKKEKETHYTLRNILKYKALYNVIFGERSNGKTYSVLEYGFEQFINSGEVEQTGIIRRMEEDITGTNGARTAYNSLICNSFAKNRISEMSKGKYCGVEYRSGKYYLTRLEKTKDDYKEVRTDKVIAYAFSLTGSEHYKQGSFPHITTVLLDEFATRGYYLNSEFILFQNVLSTIIRLRDDVKIFLCGNSVDRYNPYFDEMGLSNARHMPKNTIDLYTYGDSDLTVAVEYSDFPMKNKPSDKYFAFDNPRLKMITTGAWEISLYPHLPIKYRPCDIAYTYFIMYKNEVLQCEIIIFDKYNFTYVHKKTSDIQNKSSDLIYCTEQSPEKNWRRKISKPTNALEKKIYDYFILDKVFYQDNLTGEIVRSYLMWCDSAKIK